MCVHACMCMCAYMYLGVHACSKCVHVCVGVRWTCMYAHACWGMRVYGCVCIGCACMCWGVRACANVCTGVRMCAYVCLYMLGCACMHVCVVVCMCACICVYVCVHIPSLAVSHEEPSELGHGPAQTQDQGLSGTASSQAKSLNSRSQRPTLGEKS